jgi:hypothetical protein
MVSALLAITSKIGQIAIVKSATRMTGASDVMAEAAFGFASSQRLNCGRNPAMLVNDVKAQSSDTGKICGSASLIFLSFPSEDLPRPA